MPKKDAEYMLNKGRNTHLDVSLSENPWRQLHFSVSCKRAQLLSVPSSVWAAFPDENMWESTVSSFVSVREVSQMSETDNWDQGQQILGI